MSSSPEPSSAALLALMHTDEESGVQGIGQSELQRLKTGELDLDEYLDSAVLSATSHLSEVLHQDRLVAMREILRSQLLLHPDLRVLVDEIEQVKDLHLNKSGTNNSGSE